MCLILQNIFFISLSSVVVGQYRNGTLETGLTDSLNPCSEINNIFLAPGVLASGATNRGCFSRFHVEGLALLTLSLLTADNQSSRFYKEISTGDGGCIDFTVPQLPNRKAELTVRVSYPSHACSWTRSISVRASSSRVLIIQTERRRYRAEDLVKIRLTALRSDLTPRHSPIDEIWLEGPSGTWGDGAKVAQWKKVRTRLGIAQVQYKLDDHPVPGKWTVRAKLADGSQGSTNFWVGDYQLPPFQLSVKHSPKILKTSERLVWNVCVRYPWSEAVEGILVIRLRGSGVASGVRTAVRLKAPRACHRHAVASKRVGLGDPQPPDVIIADFSFQEEGTGSWQNTTVISQVVEHPISLQFNAKPKSIIVQGLPFAVTAKATRYDGKPATNEELQICRAPAIDGQKTADAYKTCLSAVTDIKGIARVTFNRSSEDKNDYYQFEASVRNQSSIHAPPLYLAIQRHGPGASFGDISEESKYPGARVYVPLFVNLKNFVRPLTVHFVIITRNGVLFRWASTTQCPSSSDRYHIVTKNFDCRNEVSQDSNGGPLKVLLPIKISHQMCPDSQLLAFFLHNGEFVSANLYLDIEECFVNKAELTWSPRQVAPGSTSSLTISTTSTSLCGLTAIDVASKWLQEPGLGVQESVLSELKKTVGAHRNMTVFDTFGECYDSDLLTPPTSSMQTLVSWMAEAGVRMVTNSAVTKTCDVTTPAPLTNEIHDENAPRSDFVEAWLWRLTPVGLNGTAVLTSKVPETVTRFEATALCVSKSGLAVPPPAVLQVFQEFFIHADAPKKLRRGDNTVIKYRIFNYLYEPLSVQIQILAEPHLEVLTPVTNSGCIAPRSSIARYAELKARIAGKTRISVRATADGDHRCGNSSRRGDGVHVTDEVILEMTVDHEGVPMREHRSALLCANENRYSSPSQVTWSWPSVKSVPGTEILTVWAASDISGPLYADADDLVVLPRGCGEQNMARMATSLLALKNLDPTSPVAVTAMDNVARGFSRQLQYAHPSGGFSAFGEADGVPSTWLTAFSVRYMRRAHEVLSPGTPIPQALARSEHWLLHQQMENGCFRPEGQIFHRELKGGLGEDGDISNVALTAYVMTSLMESSFVIPTRVMNSALACLRALAPVKSVTPNRVYSQALLTYTFMKLRSYEEEARRSNEAFPISDTKADQLHPDEEMRLLGDLMQMARRTVDYVWWETGSLSTSIEASAYALLALSSCPPSLLQSHYAQDARAIVRWLSSHRNAAGGFMSTQDTLVALEALTTWSSLQPSDPVNMTVTATSLNDVKSVKLSSEGGRIPALMMMKVGLDVGVKVQGTGCALIQATRTYNSYEVPESSYKVLSAQVSVHTDGPFACDKNGTFCFCAAVVEVCVVWTGPFPEMALLEVALPGGFGADPSRLYSQMNNANTLIRRIELSPNSAKSTFYLGTRDGSTIMTSQPGHQCYQLHAVGPRAKTKPAFVKIFDYYNTLVNDTQVYTIPEECLPPIADNTKPKKDSKARSLSDFFIGDEFSDYPDYLTPIDYYDFDNIRGREDGNLEVENRERETEDKEPRNRDDKGRGSDLNKEIRFVDSKEDATNVTESILTNQSEYIEQISTNQDKEPRNRDDEGKSSDVHKEMRFVDSKEDATNATKSILTNLNEYTEQISTNQDKVSNELTNEKTLFVSNEIVQKEDIKDLRVDENEGLKDFHVIDSATDLDVPSGVEGPVPVVVAPPPGFIVEQTEIPTIKQKSKQLYRVPAYYPTDFNPYFYTNANMKVINSYG